MSPTATVPKFNEVSDVISKIAVSARTLIIAVKERDGSCGSLLKTFTVADSVASDVKDDASKARFKSPEPPPVIAAGAVTVSQGGTTVVPGRGSISSVISVALSPPSL